MLSHTWMALVGIFIIIMHCSYVIFVPQCDGLTLQVFIEGQLLFTSADTNIHMGRMRHHAQSRYLCLTLIIKRSTCLFYNHSWTSPNISLFTTWKQCFHVVIWLICNLHQSLDLAIPQVTTSRMFPSTLYSNTFLDIFLHA